MEKQKDMRHPQKEETETPGIRVKRTRAKCVQYCWSAMPEKGKVIRIIKRVTSRFRTGAGDLSTKIDLYD